GTTLFESGRFIHPRVNLRAVSSLERNYGRIYPGVFPKLRRWGGRNLRCLSASLVLLYIQLGRLVAVGMNQREPFFVRRDEGLIPAGHTGEFGSLSASYRHRIKMSLSRVHLACGNEESRLVVR